MLALIKNRIAQGICSVGIPACRQAGIADGKWF